MKEVPPKLKMKEVSAKRMEGARNTEKNGDKRESPISHFYTDEPKTRILLY